MKGYKNFWFLYGGIIVVALCFTIFRSYWQQKEEPFLSLDNFYWAIFLLFIFAAIEVYVRFFQKDAAVVDSNEQTKSGEENT